MIHAFRLPLRRKIASIRLYSAGFESQESPSSVAKWLIDLEAQTKIREQEHTAKLQCLGKIGEALHATSAQVEANLVAVTSLATELGLSLAHEIVGDAIDRECIDATATVLRTLESVILPAKESGISIFLSTPDFSTVVTELQALPEFAPLASQAEFFVDPTLSQGAVRIETGAGKLRYDPQEVLSLLCEEVRREASG